MKIKKTSLVTLLSSVEQGVVIMVRIGCYTWKLEQKMGSANAVLAKPLQQRLRGGDKRAKSVNNDFPDFPLKRRMGTII